MFFPYLLANYPSPSAFADIFDLTLEYADTIEVGLPFSDPVADGPILREASQRVLQDAFRIDSVFQVLESSKQARRKSGTRIAMMTYANPVLFYGRREFMKTCGQAGVTSVIVPDVPFEECAEWKADSNAAGLSWIQFVSPVTRPERLRQIASKAEGFVYMLSLTGITGSTIRGPEAICKKAQQIKEHTDVPVALGFGIKSPQDLAFYSNEIDAFIVGSRIVEQINEKKPLENLYREFRAALREG